ncbi:MAG: DUF1593 domain-containing protein [Sedimentisphaerales bacterium]|nr:DUF1593 domain-containing protein [Sedimentisphaerales bacterium]
MARFSVYFLLTCLYLMVSLGISPCQAQRPRVIVLTDIANEPDDEQSMVRFLVYSNEYEVEGLIATTSVWLQDKVVPEKILERIEAYGKVRENLHKHAPGFPTGEQLTSAVKSGRPEFGMKGVGANKSSDGSRHIINVVDKEDPRPVWVTVWGGANCLAQALWDVKNSRSTEEVDKFVAKLRVYTISDQDDSGRWMRLTFPKLFYIVSPSSVDHHEYHKATWTGISGDRFYKNGPMHKFALVDNPWLEENIIQGHGPLGELYPKLEYIMEGDTPSFLGLIDNGLGSHISPAYGGWGGRYVLHQTYAETRPIWTNVRGSRDTVTADNGITETSDQATIWRWRQAYQQDFAARMDWCVRDPNQANHNPVAVVNGLGGKEVIHITAKPDVKVTLSAEGSADPDGNTITYSWFQYLEAGTCNKEIQLTGPDTLTASFMTPQDEPGKTIHILLQLQDNGEPNLFSYRRIIVTIAAKEELKQETAEQQNVNPNP